MGQIANQMLLEYLLKLRERCRQKKAEQKNKKTAEKENK